MLNTPLTSYKELNILFTAILYHKYNTSNKGPPAFKPANLSVLCVRNGMHQDTLAEPPVIDIRREIFCNEHCERSFFATATAIQIGDYHRAQGGRGRR
jgi:hypothetical protein